MTASGAERGFTPPAVRSVDAADGVTLLYRAWEVDDPRACVRIVHGLGEHGGRYSPLAEALRERGISTFAPDLRGHGVSGGRRGHVGSFEEYLLDLELVTEATRRSAPTILFGHSLGGLIAVRAIQTGHAGPVAGAILSAPALELAGPAPRWRDPAAAVLSRLAPTLALPNGIDPADLSRDPAAVAAYEADPLVHDRITPRLFAQMRSAMKAAARAAGEIQVPVLLLAPGDDRITRVSTAREVCGRFAGEVEVREYPHHFHEPLNELDAAAVLSDLLSWIERRIA